MGAFSFSTLVPAFYERMGSKTHSFRQSFSQLPQFSSSLKHCYESAIIEKKSCLSLKFLLKFLNTISYLDQRLLLEELKIFRLRSLQ